MLAPTHICETCGNVGRPRTVAPGSFLVEVLCYVCFCLPGMIYSAWRITSKKKVCATCSGETIVPMNTPRGAYLLAHYHPQQLPPRY